MCHEDGRRLLGSAEMGLYFVHSLPWFCGKASKLSAECELNGKATFKNYFTHSVTAFARSGEFCGRVKFGLDCRDLRPFAGRQLFIPRFKSGGDAADEGQLFLAAGIDVGIAAGANAGSGPVQVTG